MAGWSGALNERIFSTVVRPKIEKKDGNFLARSYFNTGPPNNDYKVGQKVLLRKEGILRKAESRWHKKPWLITSVYTNGAITVQRGNKIERMNIRRVKPFEEDLDNE
jgi:hypothetical protein